MVQCPIRVKYEEWMCKSLSNSKKKLVTSRAIYTCEQGYFSTFNHPRSIIEYHFVFICDQCLWNRVNVPTVGYSVCVDLTVRDEQLGYCPTGEVNFRLFAAAMKCGLMGAMWACTLVDIQYCSTVRIMTCSLTHPGPLFRSGESHWTGFSSTTKATKNHIHM